MENTTGRPAASSPIDVRSLRDRCMGDMAFVVKVLGLFKTQGPATMTKAEQAIAAGDLAKAGIAAHTLKGMAANVSAIALSEAAGELETTCKASPADAMAVTARLMSVKTEVQRCLSYIPTIVQASP